MLVMVVFFIAFRWIHLSTPLIRLFLLVLILLLMPTLNFLPVWFALSLLRFRLPSQSEDRKSGSAGMPRPISYAVFCLKKKNHFCHAVECDRKTEGIRRNSDRRDVKSGVA